MTTAQRHRGSAAGYNHVHMLVQKAQATGKGVKVRYVLMAAARNDFRVMWNIPNGSDNNVKGSIFVQYIAL